MCDMKLPEMIKYEIFTCLGKKKNPLGCVCISYCTSYEELWLQKKVLSFNKNALLNSQDT